MLQSPSHEQYIWLVHCYNGQDRNYIYSVRKWNERDVWHGKCFNFILYRWHKIECWMVIVNGVAVGVCERECERKHTSIQIELGLGEVELKIGSCCAARRIVCYPECLLYVPSMVRTFFAFSREKCECFIGENLVANINKKTANWNLANEKNRNRENRKSEREGENVESHNNRK